MNRSLFSSARPDWETPQKLYDELNEKYKFTIDVCALPHNAKHELFFSPEEDALKRSWGGHRCWMNPPYGQEIGKWVHKASTEANSRNALVVGLLPARTDTRWWHDYVLGATAIQFVKGRIKFVGAKSSAPFPSAIVQWGDL